LNSSVLSYPEAEHVLGHGSICNNRKFLRIPEKFSTIAGVRGRREWNISKKNFSKVFHSLANENP
jgi:hypothetical protein